eukprot:COSAG01_NODE_8044_length_2944_cov_1.052373_5_plen_181_part_00
MSQPAASNESKEQKTRGKSVRQSNITAARAHPPRGGPSAALCLCARGHCHPHPRLALCTLRSRPWPGAIADAVRTSLGPKGMDKMVRRPFPVPRSLSPPLVTLRPWRLSWRRSSKAGTAHPGALSQIVGAGGDVIITNDGATIVKKMEVKHAAAQMVRAHSADAAAHWLPAAVHSCGRGG